MASNGPFTFSERVGLLFIIEGAVLSLVAVTVILCFALFKWLRRTVITWRRKGASDASDSSLFLNLMLADLIQAVGSLPNSRWMSDAMVSEGSLCTAQAILKQIGIVGVSMTSLVIAIHTFVVLVLRWMPPRHASKTAVAIIWVFTALIIGIPNAVHRNKSYYGPNGFWCWIRKEWLAEMIVTEYLWVWLAAFCMLVLYTIMFCVMNGWLDIGKTFESPHSTEVVSEANHMEAPDESEEDKETKAIATMMLYFPAVYIITILPNSISRWLQFSRGYPPSSKFTLFANTIFALSGLFNFILFFLTRPAIVVGENIQVMEPPHTPHAPSITKQSCSESSSLGQLPERKEHSSRMQNASRDSTISSAGYLTANRENHRQQRRTPQSSNDDEDYGYLPR